MLLLLFLKILLLWKDMNDVMAPTVILNRHHCHSTYNSQCERVLALPLFHTLTKASQTRHSNEAGIIFYIFLCKHSCFCDIGRFCISFEHECPWVVDSPALSVHWDRCYSVWLKHPNHRWWMLNMASAWCSKRHEKVGRPVTCAHLTPKHQSPSLRIFSENHMPKHIFAPP